MLFNSLTFFVFLSIVLVLYWRMPLRTQNIFLVLASFVFYAFWDVRFLFLITLTTAIDFYAAQFIHEGKLGGKPRLSGTLWTLATCLIFVVIPYKNISIEHFTPEGLLPLVSNLTGWKIFATVAVFVLLCNSLYPFVAKMPDQKRRKTLLAFTIVVKLGVLGFFKYYGFFIDNLSGLITTIGFNPALLHLHIILPVGISFYIFHTMSYTIDVYKGKMEPTRQFVDFALFVSFFPLLAAGPIVRASSLLPIMSSPRTFRAEQMTRGLFLILFGLFKKVAIADGVARTVTQVFGASGHLSWTDCVLGTLCFCVQIYCDFSGYSDIARGTGKLLGMDIMRNFNLPYFSRDPSEFWTRWHISLSSWLRDYLYIPLGGNRKGRLRTYINLMITMFLGGLWHGAAWNFVLWGTYQGAVLCIYRFLEEAKIIKQKQDSVIIGAFKWLIFFAITCYGWLLFRSHSFGTIARLTKTLISGFGDFSINVALPMPAALLGIPLLIAIDGLAFKIGDDRFYQKLPVFSQGLIFASLCLVLVLGTTNAPVQFIYFTF
jgi:alginate O-acetyltransferase complex protein AlgI